MADNIMEINIRVVCGNCGTEVSSISRPDPHGALRVTSRFKCESCGHWIEATTFLESEYYSRTDAHTIHKGK
jgi:hypothetical protein